MRAAIYSRVSTEEQIHGYGLDVQRERCRAMATVKGWTVVGEYADEGLSGTKSQADRPQLAALLQACDAGDVDAVIVLALDRLGRKTRLVLELVDTLTARGVTLVSCKESLDTSTPQGQFVLTMFAALAQLERDTIVERTTAGRNQRGNQDGEKGGRLPYGYIRTPTGVQVEEQAAAVVRRIFAARAGGATLREIAHQLNERQPVSPRGGQWYASGVRDVLSNERAYHGATRGASAVQWPAIL